MGKAQQLSYHKSANHKVNRPFQLCYVYLIEPFMPVTIGGYTYVGKGGEYTGEEFRQYCLKTGVIQEFAATNTP